MVYPLDFEQLVGFSPIRTSVVQRCRYQLTKDNAVSWGMSTQFEQIVYELDALDEVNQIRERIPSLLQLGGSDIGGFLHLLQVENAYLEEEELQILGDILRTYQKFSSSMQVRAEEFPILAHRLPGRSAPKEVLDVLAKVLDEFGNISVKASPTYAKILNNIQRLEGEARQLVRGVFREWKNLGYTAETDVSVREERLVIPVLAEFKRKVQGFVKDVSATGKILYVEPAQALELNNRLKELYAEQRRERERILKQLTSELSPYQAEFQAIMASLSVVDFWIAKCDWCAANAAERPKLSAEPTIHLVKAVHPVLKQELQQQKLSPVPLSLSLTDQRIMVVSGPNAGGKSVVLKTTLLLQYMVQCGLFITALPESKLGVFEFLGIDCGDGQSIEQGLSTFSAHLKGLKLILDHAGDRSLVGLDEIGAGTDPRFGAPIAQAVLEQLLEKHSLVVATTHFSQLREWGVGIEQVIQASMAYDAHALKPLYRLVVGKPGSSFALELMRKTGFDTDWIERIKVLAGHQMGKTEDLMLQLERQNHLLQQQNQEYEEKLQHLETLTDSYQQLKDKLQQKRQDYLNAAREEARKLVQDTNQQIEQTIRIIKEHRAEKEVTKQAREKLDKHKERLYNDIAEAMKMAKQQGYGNGHDPQLSGMVEKSKKQPGNQSPSHGGGKKSPTVQPKLPPPPVMVNLATLKPGAKVRSVATEMSGEVLDVKKEKVWVAFGLIKMWVPAAELAYEQGSGNANAGKKHRPDIGFNWVDKQSKFSANLDVRGCRLDEALQKTQHWLDEAYALGQNELNLIHGRGDGILRKGLKDYLRTLNYIRSYVYQTEAAGGDGCLVIHLM